MIFFQQIYFVLYSTSVIPYHHCLLVQKKSLNAMVIDYLFSLYRKYCRKYVAMRCLLHVHITLVTTTVVTTNNHGYGNNQKFG